LLVSSAVAVIDDAVACNSVEAEATDFNTDEISESNLSVKSLSLSDLGLIDEYHLYFRPFVLGRGKPYFAGARPPLRLVATDPVGEDAVRLTFAPA
jgi:hypothetical protein